MHERVKKAVKMIRAHFKALGGVCRCHGCSPGSSAPIHERCDVVWLDDERMGSAAQGSGDLDAAMSDGIEECPIFIMFVSKEYSTSRNCQLEAAYASNRKKVILFVLIGSEPISPSLTWFPQGGDVF